MKKEKEIDACLNCKASECTGDYPYCCGYDSSVEKGKYRKTKLRSIGRGNATVLVCLLVKIGLKRRQIAELCGATQNSVNSLIRVGLDKGIITKAEADSSRVNKRQC